MTLSCTFHPGRSAHFQCEHCDISFCDQCVSSREVSRYSEEELVYYCPACDGIPTLVGLSNILPPFWKKLGSIFLYPLQPAPLIFTMVLAVLGGLLYFNWIAQLFIWIVMMKYAYAVMISTAKGGLKAPAITWSLINDDVMQVFKQYGIFLLAGFCIAFMFHQFGVVGGGLFVVFVAAFLPAIIMLLVATNSIIHAINPMLFVPIVFRIGSSYLLLYLFLIFLSAAPLSIYSLLPAKLPPQLWKGLTLFLGQIYTLISYHLLGYVLLQNHEKIGYSVDYEYFVQYGKQRPVKDRKTQKEKFLHTIEILIQGGFYDKALVLLREKIAVDSPDIKLSEKYYTLLQLAGKKKKVHNYASIHLSHLVKRNLQKKAFELFSQIIQNDLKPPPQPIIFQIAKWYELKGNYKKGLDSYLYFIRKNKGHDAIAEAYFKVARILNERGRKKQKAKQILGSLIKTFPNHPIIPMVKSYFRTIG